jgi:hypothetical protein
MKTLKREEVYCRELGGVFFVTRMKTNTVYRVEQECEIPAKGNVLRDQIISLPALRKAGEDPVLFRRIEYWNEEKREILQLTLMASSLYRLLGRRVGNGYDTAESRHIFRDLVDATAQVAITDKEIEVRFQKRAHSPLLLAAGFDKTALPIPWLDGKRPGTSYCITAAIIAETQSLVNVFAVVDGGRYRTRTCDLVRVKQGVMAEKSFCFQQLPYSVESNWSPHRPFPTKPA